MPFLPGLALTLLANAGISLAAFGLYRVCRTGERGPDLLWYGVVRWALMAAVVIVLGSLHLLQWWSLGAVAVVGGVGVLALWRGEVASVLRVPGEMRDRIRAWWRTADLSSRTAAIGAACLALLLAARIAFAVWFFAPCPGDETFFQLPKLANWIQTGTLSHPNLEDVRSSYPAGFELLEVWWVAFLHHDVIIELAGVEVLLYAAAAVFTLGRRLGLARPQAALAALLFCGLPVVNTQSTACCSSIAMTALAIAGFALAMGTGPAWRDAGFVAGVTLLGLSFSPLFLCLVPGFIVIAMFRRRTASPPSPVNPGRVVVLLLVAGVGLFWYGRNAYDFGNPVYPLGDWSPFSYRANYTMVPRLDSTNLVSSPLEALRLNASTLMNTYLYDAYVPYGHLTNRQAGWGWYGMALGLPALLLVLRWRTFPVSFAAGVVAAGGVLFATIQPDYWNMRHAGWLAVLPCLAIPVVLWRVEAVPRRAGAYLLMIGLALNIVGTTVVDGVAPEAVRRSIAASWSDRSGWELMTPEPLSRVEPVCSIGVTYPVYTLYGPDYGRRVVLLRFGTIQEVERVMRASGMRTLVVGDLRPVEMAVLARRLRERVFVPVGERVYRLQGGP